MYQLQNTETHPPTTFFSETRVSHQPSYTNLTDFHIKNEHNNNSGPLESISEAIVQNSNTSDRQDQSPKSNNFTPSCAGTSKSPGERRRRIVFSLHQLHVLQQTFEEHRYISQKKRQELAKELGLTEVQVCIQISITLEARDSGVRLLDFRMANFEGVRSDLGALDWVTLMGAWSSLEKWVTF